MKVLSEIKMLSVRELATLCFIMAWYESHPKVSAAFLYNALDAAYVFKPTDAVYAARKTVFTFATTHS